MTLWVTLSEPKATADPSAEEGARTVGMTPCGGKSSEQIPGGMTKEKSKRPKSFLNRKRLPDGSLFPD
jgi:hypothetical protein